MAVRKAAMNGPVEVKSMNQPKPGWNAADAISLVDQGYSEEHASQVSGFSVSFIRAQLQIREDAKRQKRIERRRARENVVFPVRRSAVQRT